MELQRKKSHVHKFIKQYLKGGKLKKNNNKDTWHGKAKALRVRGRGEPIDRWTGEELGERGHGSDLHLQSRNVIGRFFQKVRQRDFPTTGNQPA